MDTRTFLVEISKSWAWPFLWVVFFIVFYTQIINISAAAGRLIDRLKRFKAPGFELSTEAYQAAVEANKDRTQEIEKKIVSEGLSLQEKTELLEKLKAAVAETERFRLILQEKSVATVRHETPRTMFHPLRIIAKHLGSNSVLEQALTDETGVQKRVSDSISRVKRGEVFHKYLNRLGVEQLVNENLLDAAGNLTSAGYVEFKGYAQMELSRPSPLP